MDRWRVSYRLRPLLEGGRGERCGRTEIRKKKRREKRKDLVAGK